VRVIFVVSHFFGVDRQPLRLEPLQHLPDQRLITMQTPARTCTATRSKVITRIILMRVIANPRSERLLPQLSVGADQMKVREGGLQIGNPLRP
jgi:hypothetical protein